MNPIIENWMNAYYQYLEVNLPDITQEEKEEQWVSKTNSMISQFNENPVMWSNNIATLLIVTTDEYNRLSENLIHIGYQPNENKSRWLP